MRPSELVLSIETLYRANEPIYIEGSPGQGKTSIPKQVAAKLGIGFKCYVLSQFDRVDFTGVPYVLNGITKWATPDIFPTEGSGFFVLDEFNAAPRELQPPCYQFMQERRIGDYHLPPGWLPMATGNLSTDRAITNKLSSAFSNRVVHLTLDLHLDDWCKWAVENDVSPVVIAFARFRPTLFAEGFDPNERINMTPRTLEKVSNVLKTRPDPKIRHALIAGTIGERHAVELTGFIEVWRRLPSIDSILLNPTTAPIPLDDNATLFALAGGLARKSTDQNFDRVMTYADRMPKEWQVYLVKDATRRDLGLQNTNAFIKWASLNSEIMG